MRASCRWLAIIASLSAVSAILAQSPSVVWSAKTRSAINAVQFSPNGQIIATGSDDGKVKLWNAANGKLLATVANHFDRVLSLAFSPDGSLLLTGGHDDEIHLVRMSDRSTLYTISETGFVNGLSFAADGQTFYAALGYFSRDLRQFRTADGMLWSITHHHYGEIWSVDCSRDGQHVVTAGADGKVLLYDVPMWNPTELSMHENDAIVAKFSPNSALVASAGEYEGKVKLHGVSSGALLRTIDFGATIRSISWSPNGSMVAVSGHALPSGGRIAFYRISDGSLAASYSGGTAESVNAIAVSPGGTTFAYGRDDGALVLARAPAVKGGF
jgi:WD40 repeat protein